MSDEISNSGKRNSGNRNSGNHNSGNRNTGDYNSGNRNSGNYSSGNYSSGYYNTGDRNTGDYNSGNRNSGKRNSGNYNSGNYNTGNHNSGDRNTGNHNTGDRNTGSCNTNDPTVRLFNKDSGWEFNCHKHLALRRLISSKQIPLCEWVSESDMKDVEKLENESYKTTGGYLKVHSERFNGEDLTKEEIDFLEAIPNFDAAMFLECTGIDINNNQKKLIIDGKEIMISKESFEAIKKQFI